MLEVVAKSLKAAKRDRISYLAASITFYALFALAPVIIIFISVAGVLFGEQAAKGELVNQIQYFVGPELASAVQVIVENAALSQSNYLFTLLSLLILLFAASRVVTYLKFSLNLIWESDLDVHKKLHKAIKSKFLSMLVILGVGLFFVLLLVTSGLMSALWVFLANILPIQAFVFQIVNIIISFGMLTLLIAVIHKFLPDNEIEWKDVWLGAVFTAVLLMMGNWLIGLYMRNFSIQSVYGAAGSVVIILIWLYYISQIFLFGAEFIKQYSHIKGSNRKIFKKILDKF